MTASGRRLLVGACGSVAVLGLPQYVLRLKADHDAEVRVILTRSAQRFIPLDVARLFCDVAVDGGDEWQPGLGHVELGTWADLFVVLPASATALASLASGTGAGLLASAALAHPDPLLVFPNMNRVMWENVAVARNVAQLRADGHTVVEPRLVPAYETGTRSTALSAVMPALDEISAAVGEAYAGRAGASDG